MCAYWKNTSTLGALEFYHNNIRDFFLCEYLYDVLYTHFQSFNNAQWVNELINELCKMFAWGDIAGTTWEQSFSFLYLRLKYESEYLKDGNNLFSLLQKNNSISFIMHQLIRSHELWDSTCAESPYISAKHIFCNSLMLFRIFKEFSLCTQDNKLINLWCSEEDKALWERMSILQDWHVILRKTVQISDSEQIGIVSKTNLSEIKLNRVILDDADFQGCSFEKASFEKASLSGAVFADASLQNVSFRGANLNYADFSGAILSDVDFTGADLKNAIFIGTKIQNCNWTGCTLANNDFSSASISRLVVKKKASDLIFSNAFVSNSSFQNCKFNDLIISEGTEFAETSFSNSEFLGEIRDVHFAMCTFEKCNFNGVSSLSRVFFGGCSCIEAEFCGLKLDSVDFVDSDLRKTRFVNTTFKKCSISGLKTKLEGADFSRGDGTGLNYEGINFYGVHLRNAIGFEKCERRNPYLALK